MWVECKFILNSDLFLFPFEYQCFPPQNCKTVHHGTRNSPKQGTREALKQGSQTATMTQGLNMKLFSCSTEFSMKFQLFLKCKMVKIKKVFSQMLYLSIVYILTFMSRINFMLS